MQRTYALLMVVLVSFVVVYVVFHVHNALQSPEVSILSPLPNQTSPAHFTLRGSVKRAVSLTVNNRTVLPTSEGIFETFMILPAGYSIVSVYAKGLHGQRTTETLPLYIQDIQDYESSKKETDTTGER